MSAPNTLENRKKFVPAKIVKDENTNLHLKLLDKPVRVRAYHSENTSDQVLVTKEERKETSDSHPPKRYVTTCYFQPKQDPVSYSETVIITIGSSKKHYFDTIMYQTKLVPFRWTETMTTSTSFAVDDYQAHHQAFVEQPGFHYMSLEPQQIAATEKVATQQEIAV